MRQRFLIFLVLALALSASAESRRRAVRAPAPQCAFSISSQVPDPVSDGGLLRGAIRVIPSPSSCTSWAAFSPVDWITIETDSDNAYVTVLPNSAQEVRSARVLIAGVQVNIAQLGRPVIADPTMIQNGDFDVDLSHWGWQDRFPNGTGDASWSSLDADGSIASGSIRLRDDLNSGPAFQRLQCIVAAPGTYDYGFSVRADSRTAVEGILAFLQFDTEDCSGSYGAYPTKRVKVAAPGVWEKHELSYTVAPGMKAIMLVIGGYARQSGLQEVWIDDVFVRPR